MYQTDVIESMVMGSRTFSKLQCIACKDVFQIKPRCDQKQLVCHASLPSELQ